MSGAGNLSSLLGVLHDDDEPTPAPVPVAAPAAVPAAYAAAGMVANPYAARPVVAPQPAVYQQPAPAAAAPSQPLSRKALERNVQEETRHKLIAEYKPKIDSMAESVVLDYLSKAGAVASRHVGSQWINEEQYRTMTPHQRLIMLYVANDMDKRFTTQPPARLRGADQGPSKRQRVQPGSQADFTARMSQGRRPDGSYHSPAAIGAGGAAPGGAADGGGAAVDEEEPDVLADGDDPSLLLSSAAAVRVQPMPQDFRYKGCFLDRSSVAKLLEDTSRRSTVLTAPEMDSFEEVYKVLSLGVLSHLRDVIGRARRLSNHRREVPRGSQVTAEYFNPRAGLERIRAREEAKAKERDKVEKAARMAELELMKKQATGEEQKMLAEKLNLMKEQDRARVEAKQKHELVEGSSAVKDFMALLMKSSVPAAGAGAGAGGAAAAASGPAAAAPKPGPSGAGEAGGEKEAAADGVTDAAVKAEEAQAKEGAIAAAPSGPRPILSRGGAAASQAERGITSRDVLTALEGLPQWRGSGVVLALREKV